MCQSQDFRLVISVKSLPSPGRAVVMPQFFPLLLVLACAAAVPLRKLFVDGGCPNVDDSCYSTKQYNSFQLPGFGGTCVGTGSGLTYAPASCNFTNATQTGSNSFLLNGTCSATTVWPAKLYNTTCNPSNPMACNAPDRSLYCGAGINRCVYYRTTNCVGDPCFDSADCPGMLW